MQYYSITSSTFEDALKKAKEQYGESVRIISRRDFTTGGGIFTKKKDKCEITFYLSEKADKRDDGKSDEESLKEFEKEAQTPDPAKLSRTERLDTEIHRGAFSHSFSSVNQIMDKNYITEPLRSALLENLSEQDIMLSFADNIIKSVNIDTERILHPKHFLALIGPTGNGKSTTTFKIASIYKKQGKKVAIITLDSYKAGAYEQAKAFSDLFSIPVRIVKEEDEFLAAIEEFHYHELILIDTMGISPNDKNLNLKLRGMLKRLERENIEFSLVVSASTKEEDIINQYKRYSNYNIESVIATKVDETESIGSVISFCFKYKIPLSFVTNGQRIPEDIEKATSTVILSHIKDLNLDIKRSRQLGY